MAASWIVIALLLAACCSAARAAVACYRTPAAAADAFEERAAVAVEHDGFRVHSAWHDRASGATVAQVEHCGHPSEPWIAVELERPAAKVAKEELVAGSQVAVVTISSGLTSEGTGTALDTAYIGSVVRVRLDNALHPGVPGAIITAKAVAAHQVEWKW